MAQVFLISGSLTINLPLALFCLLDFRIILIALIGMRDTLPVLTLHTFGPGKDHNVRLTLSRCLLTLPYTHSCISRLHSDLKCARKLTCLLACCV